jgi:hypothetical protein
MSIAPTARPYRWFVGAIDGAAPPSLSQLQAWPTDHLDAAAASWTATAQSWDDAFTSAYRHAFSPGGSPWNGQSADAAIVRAGVDRLRVLGGVDALNTAAAIARNGSAELRTARQFAIAAVIDARAAGFVVGEDLSVTDPSSPARRAARVAQAQRLAAAIHNRALALVAADQTVANRISSATSELNNIRFDGGTRLPACPWGRAGAVPLGSVVVCEPYTAGGGFICFEWTLDGPVGSGWHQTDISGGYP